MIASFAILLLVIFALILWTFRQSKHVWLRAGIISMLFGFCVVFGLSIDTIMGWAAKAKYAPEIVTLLYVNIHEPNAEQADPGAIFILIRHAPTPDNLFLKTFGYTTKVAEPRLFRLPYERPLHEMLQKEVIPQLQKGQTVTGKLSKGEAGKGGKGGKGKGKGGKGKGDGEGDGEGDGDGDGKGGRGGRAGKGGKSGAPGGGSDSLESPYEFHILPPSYFMRKDPQP